MRRDSSFCAKSVRYNIFTNGALYYAVMSLQFTRVPSVACRGGLRMSRADCSIVGLYCVAISWQQICKDSRCITVAGVLLHETVERKHLGR